VRKVCPYVQVNLIWAIIVGFFWLGNGMNKGVGGWAGQEEGIERIKS